MATKIPFQTRYEYAGAIGNETGTEFDDIRGFYINSDGIRTLHKTGKTNRQEMINAHLDEILIENVVAKSSLDPRLLEQVPGMSGDFTHMPKSLFEAQNMVLKIKDEFNSLPVNVRESFSNSVDRYIMEMGTEEWKRKCGLITEIQEEIKNVVEEAKVNE